MPDEKAQAPKADEPETPSSPTPPSGTPTNAPPAEYRYANDPNLPEWARGKTASEILQLTQALVEERVRGGPPQPQYQPPAQPQTLPGPSDEDYITGRDLKAFRQAATAEFTPILERVAEQNAVTAYNIARRDHADVFRKYEPEIVQVLGRVPRGQWTLDVIENAVKFVKGNHVDELAEEKARLLVAKMEPTIRSTGSGGSASVPSNTPELSLDSDKLPARWREHAKAAGIREQELLDFCRDNYMTPDEFFAQFKDGLVTDAVQDVRVRA